MKISANRRALVLGAFGDIGKAIVDHLSAERYQILSPSRDIVDLSDAKSFERYWSSLQEKDRLLDVIIYAAGINEIKDSIAVSVADIEKAFSINVIGFVEVVKHVAAHMTENNGRVLAISSLYGQLGRKGRLPYVMSKHALEGAVRTLAIELGCRGILVNALSPGFVDTKMTRKNNSEKRIAEFRKQIPLGRLADVKDIASAALYLCSESNTYITGQIIKIDGGFSCGGFQG